MGGARCSRGEVGRWGGPRPRPRPDQMHNSSTPSKQNCSTDQNAAQAILSVCLSPALGAGMRGIRPNSERTVPIRIGPYQPPPPKKRERGWREKGAPTHTYPDHRGQSRDQHLHLPPLDPPVKRVWRSFDTRETAEKNINKTGKTVQKTLLPYFNHSSQPNILYYNDYRYI